MKSNSESVIAEIKAFLTKKSDILIEAALIMTTEKAFKSAENTFRRYLNVLPRYFDQTEQNTRDFREEIIAKRDFLYNYNIERQRKELSFLQINCEFIVKGIKNGFLIEKQERKRTCKQFPPLFTCKISLNPALADRKRQRKTAKDREKARERSRKIFSLDGFGLVDEILKWNEEVCLYGDFAEFPKKFKVLFTTFFIILHYDLKPIEFIGL